MLIQLLSLSTEACSTSPTPSIKEFSLPARQRASRIFHNKIKQSLVGQLRESGWWNSSLSSGGRWGWLCQAHGESLQALRKEGGLGFNSFGFSSSLFKVSWPKFPGCPSHFWGITDMKAGRCDGADFFWSNFQGGCCCGGLLEVIGVRRQNLGGEDTSSPLNTSLFDRRPNSIFLPRFDWEFADTESRSDTLLTLLSLLTKVKKSFPKQVNKLLETCIFINCNLS